MDTKGNLYNFYNDLDGERKITPVGNVTELQQFKVREEGRREGGGLWGGAVIVRGGTGGLQMQL